MANVVFKDYNPSPRNTQKTYSVTINIFFDGTKNNKSNSDARVNNHSSFEKYGKSDDESSYQNDWSNVARLWENCTNPNLLYIEGIGTTDLKGDSTMGYAFGSGWTGIRFKVRKGCEQAAAIIKKEMDANQGKVLREIIFNVYGFSRGAAAARNFVYEIGKAAYKGRKTETEEVTTYSDSDNMPGREEMPAGGHLGYALKVKGVTLNPAFVKVNFLGIFDTVASYSPTPVPRFSNDIGELNLNTLGKAQQVVHFTARDEMRENFSLTRSPKGLERDLPGVHSDIGGSYLTGREVKEEIETAKLSYGKLETLRDRLIADGWYKPGELTITGGWYWALRGEKQLVYKEYSFIPLHFMGSFSKDHNAQIDQEKMKGKYSIQGHPTLVSVEAKLKAYVFDGAPYPYAGRELNAANLNELKTLRYSYFHRSARREGVGMDPNNDWKRVELKE
ncbi:DUF2235 domain-containing protein [Sphingobacterium sp. BIGb0165]|uniref:T6SS phospholipase effector Tle1-like catalytic domain-containing protein n=1 Tax=Sphingobacterium sp. BIGb0165 TaxID=2940615 RepID=UPI0021677723|nr:DUF2235 domain-containing protein [Sphingobacterium sp. BIGb0165]MCS4225960.1 hypothetical protein [Sphingobacterium sp. BIGb0165]